MIRVATEADLPTLLKMGEKFRSNSKYKDYISWNEKQLEICMTKLIKLDSILVYTQNEKVVGMLGYMVYSHFFSGETVAGEIFWWMEPGYRGGGIELLREVEKRAQAAGAKHMQMIAPTERVGAVYEHLGYTFVESTFQKTL